MRAGISVTKLFIVTSALIYLIVQQKKSPPLGEDIVFSE